MALIKCTECHKEISDRAKQCPYCGCPLSSHNHKKALKLSILICAILLVVGGYTYYRYEKTQIKEAIQQHNDYLASTVSNQSYPQKPQSYEDLEYIYQHYNPTNPGCRLALYNALYTDRPNNVPFQSTKIYIDWDNNYRHNLQPKY